MQAGHSGDDECDTDGFAPGEALAEDQSAEQGLIRSTRTPGGWRDFDASMIERVVMIQHLYAAGLSSGIIGELLPCLDAPPEERTGPLEELLAQEVRRLQSKRREIDRELDVLEALRQETTTPITPR
ncbi:MAG TPA: MerR family transcriptional regulator [Kribbella sp.]